MDPKTQKLIETYLEGFQSNLRGIADEMIEIHDVLAEIRDKMNAPSTMTVTTPSTPGQSTYSPPPAAQTQAFKRGMATPAMTRYVAALIKQEVIPADIKVDLDNLSFIRAKELLDTYAPKNKS